MENSTVPISDSVAFHKANHESQTQVVSAAVVSTEPTRSGHVREDSMNGIENPGLAYGAFHRLAHILIEIARTTTAIYKKEAENKLDD